MQVTDENPLPTIDYPQSSQETLRIQSCPLESWSKPIMSAVSSYGCYKDGYTPTNPPDVSEETRVRTRHTFKTMVHIVI